MLNFRSLAENRTNYEKKIAKRKRSHTGLKIDFFFFFLFIIMNKCKLHKLGREMCLARRAAEMAHAGTYPPHSCLQRGGRCAQHQGLFCGPGTPPREVQTRRAEEWAELASALGGCCCWACGIRGTTRT